MKIYFSTLVIVLTMDLPVMLRSKEVHELSSFDECVTDVRGAYRERGEGSPAKSRMALTRADPDGYMMGYTTALLKTGVMGGYLYSTGFESGNMERAVAFRRENGSRTGAVGCSEPQSGQNRRHRRRLNQHARP